MSTATGVRLPDELLQIAKCPLRLRQSQSVPSIDSGPARLSLRLRVPKNLWQRRACKCLRLYVCNVVRYAAQKQMFLGKCRDLIRGCQTDGAEMLHGSSGIATSGNLS